MSYCGEGEVATGPKVQYTFRTFVLCSDCQTGERGKASAYIEGATHPPNPAHPPTPARALAQGKLLRPGESGAEAIYAIGRIYDLGGEYLFDGHLVPGVQQPPTPGRSFIFQGIIFQREMADLAISQERNPYTSASRISPSQGSCEAPAGGSFSCTLGSVGPGQAPKITVELGTPACLGSPVGITSTAWVTSDTAELTPDNNSSARRKESSLPSPAPAP